MRICGDAVEDDATKIVREDSTTRSTGCWKQISDSGDKETAKILKGKTRRLGRDLGCEGPRDHRVTDYREGLVLRGEEQATT